MISDGISEKHIVIPKIKLHVLYVDVFFCSILNRVIQKKTSTYIFAVSLPNFVHC